MVERKNVNKQASHMTMGLLWHSCSIEIAPRYGFAGMPGKRRINTEAILLARRCCGSVPKAPAQGKLTTMLLMPQQIT